MRSKWRFYVGLINNGAIDSYVTRITINANRFNEVVCEKGKEALSLRATTARDIAGTLTENGRPAVVIKAPYYFKFRSEEGIVFEDRSL